MSPEMIISIARYAVETAFMVSMPMLIAAMLVGFGVSVFQAATQINEQTMTFIPKIAAVLITLVIFAPWMLQKMTNFTTYLISLSSQLGG